MDLVRADVLRDSAGFACSHVGQTDRIEQRSLSVVDVAHDGDDRRAHDLGHAGRVFEEALDRLVLHLLFDGDDGCVRAELSRHILHQLAFERLVDGDEDTAHQQRCDQVLAANVELLGEVLHADAFRHRDGAGDRQWLVRNLCSAKTWRRSEALHRAFLGLLVTLVAAATLRRTANGTSARNLARWRQQATGTRRAARSCTESWTCTKSWTSTWSAWAAKSWSTTWTAWSTRPPGKVRVGCMGRRAPGGSGGREPGAPGACGRGRSKIGRLRGGAPGAGGGAEYVGRGPVCGMITRRTGAAGAELARRNGSSRYLEQQRGVVRGCFDRRGSRRGCLQPQELQPPVLPAEEPLASARRLPEAQPTTGRSCAGGRRSATAAVAGGRAITGPDGRLAGNCRCCRGRSHNVRSLTRQRHDLPRSLRSRCRLCRRRSPERRPHWAASPASAQQAWPHEQRTVEPRLPDELPPEALPSPLPQPASARELPSGHRRALTPSTGQTSACCRPLVSTSVALRDAASQICAYLLRLIDFDGAGVCFFLRDANRGKSVQNGLALYFQFACQIVDSNFAHPSLFRFPSALSCSYRPLRGRNRCKLLSLKLLHPRPLQMPCAAASHGRVRRQCLRLRPPGLHRPACLPCRCPTQSAPREHPHR